MMFVSQIPLTLLSGLCDNPFVDPCEVDYLVDFFRIGKYDYAYNHIPVNNSYPDGLAQK